MESQGAGVAESGRRKGLKISCGFSKDIGTPSENRESVSIRGIPAPSEMPAILGVLETPSGFPIPVKKVRNGAGKRYAYLRGTDIAVVSGFVGSADDFDAAIRDAIRDYKREVAGKIEGWRLDAAKAMHKATKARATQRCLPYTLSVEWLVGMLSTVKDRCEVTGIPFDYGPNKQGWRVRPLAPSLDRIENGHGYEPANVRLVCACVNIAINEWGLENFERVCRAFVERRQA